MPSLAQPLLPRSRLQQLAGSRPASPWLLAPRIIVGRPWAVARRFAGVHLPSFSLPTHGLHTPWALQRILPHTRGLRGMVAPSTFSQHQPVASVTRGTYLGRMRRPTPLTPVSALLLDF